MSSDLYMILFATFIVGFLLIAYWEDLEFEERLAGIIASLIVIPCLPLVIAAHPETGEWRLCYRDQVPTYEVEVGPAIDTEFGTLKSVKERRWKIQYLFSNNPRGRGLVFCVIGLALFKTLPLLLAPMIYYRRN